MIKSIACTILFLSLWLSLAGPVQAQTLQITCPRDEPGSIFLDGKFKKRCPGTISVKPGYHQTEVRFDSGGKWVMPVKVEKRSKLKFAAEPQEAAPPPTPPENSGEPVFDDTNPPPHAAEPAFTKPTEALIEPEPAPPEKRWYIPTEKDEEIPWNKHDPWHDWGNAVRAALEYQLDGYFVGNSGTVAAHEVGVSLGNNAAAGYAGVYLIRGKPLANVGLEFAKNYGYRLYDAGLPDVSVGLHHLGLTVKILASKQFLGGNFTIPLLGMRTVIDDFTVFDVRLISNSIVVYDMDNSDLIWAVGMGFSLEPGIEF